MEEQITTLLTKLKTNSILFNEVTAFIDRQLEHTPTAFKNGEVYNDANQNQGSAKVFRFAEFNDLSKEDTLLLFAEHYLSVLASPEGIDHQNIRQFMAKGWDGIKF